LFNINFSFSLPPFGINPSNPHSSFTETTKRSKSSIGRNFIDPHDDLMEYTVSKYQKSVSTFFFVLFCNL
jgi:hypothetical protein